MPQLLDSLRDHPEQIEFSAVINYIERHYEYHPTRFRNGELINEAGKNEGSCKLLAFAKLQQLSDQETLALFGRYYREDVLQNPQGTDHSNIRNLMRTGLAGVQFDQHALRPKF